MAVVAELDILFNAETGGAVAAMGGMQDQLLRTAIAGKNIGGFFTDGFKAMTSSAIDLETQMRNVNSIAQQDEATLAMWTDQVQELAMTWGESSVTLAAGMYQIQSAGFSAADSLEILESASMAARAGLTTTEVAADAVTSVLNSYRENIGSTTQAYQALNSEGERAEYIQNVLFRGVDRGKMTYEQLARSIGRVAAVASTAGLSIEDITGGMALMTQQGLSAAESGTALFNTINAFIKPTTAMTDAVTALGYESPIAMLSTLGLAETMNVLEDYTGGAADKIGELFGNIRGQRGATLLMNGDLRTMIEMMEDAQGGAGKLSAMELALEQQTMSTQFAIDVFKATFEVLGQELVQTFLPAIRVILGAFVDFAKMMVSLPQPIKTFLGAMIGLVGAFFTAVGAVALWMALFAPIIGLLGLLTAAILAVSVPLATLFTLFATFGFRDTIQGFSDILDAFNVPFLDHFTNSVERAKEAWDSFMLFNNTQSFAPMSGIAADLGALGAALIAFADSTSDLDFADGPLGEMGDFLGKLAIGIDLFNRAYDRWRGKEKVDTTSDFGVPDVFDDGQIQYSRGKVESLALAWQDFSAYAYDTWPGQTELIGQMDRGMRGLFSTMNLLQTGQWTQAWEELQYSMGNFGEAAKTIGTNLKNAIDGIDWGSVYDSIGTNLDAAFNNVTQAIDWVAYVGIPTVLGWLSEHAGDAWDAIKALAGVAVGVGGWIGDRATEIVNWTIDIAIPNVIGYGKYILGNLRNWLIGQMGGAGIGFGSGAGMGSGGVGGELGEMDLGTLIAKYKVDVLEPAFMSVVNNIKGWIIGKLTPGGGVPSPGLGSGNGAGSGGLGSYDLGTVVATWAINVLEPTLAGWINSAAGWLQGKLQAYVNGAGGNVGGMGAGGAAFYGGNAGGAGITFANWAINVLEPLVNLSGADIHGAIQRAVQIAGSVGSYTVSGIFIVLSQITGEDVSSSSDIPGAIQTFITNTKAEYNKAVAIKLNLSMAIGGLSMGGNGSGGGTGAYSEGIGGTRGYAGNPAGMIQQFFESSLFGSGGAEFYQTVKAFLNYEVTEGPGDVLNAAIKAIDTAKALWEKPGEWLKSIKLGIKLAFPDWLGDIAGNDLVQAGLMATNPWLAPLLDFYNDYVESAKEAETAAQEAAAASDAANAAAGAVAPIRAMPMAGAAPVLSGRGGLPKPPPVLGPAQPVPAEAPQGITTLPQVGAGPPDMRGEFTRSASVAIEGYRAEMTKIAPVTQQAAQGIIPAWNNAFQPFGSGVATQAGNVTRDLGAGLAPMPNTASTTASDTTGALGVGLGAMAPLSNTAGGAASSGLGTGIAGMPVAGGAAGRMTTGAVGAGLAPLPGQTGATARSAGQSFQIGITTGFVQAAVAAYTGAAAIRNAANSIGSLYGAGYSVGSSLGQGVAAGIWSQVGAVSAASAALASAAAAGAQARGQISSPSRLMFNEVGVPLAQGVVAGIESQKDNVAQAMDDMIGQGNGTYTLPRSKVVAIYNSHQYVLEPEAWIQVQRDSKMSAEQLRQMNSRARTQVRSKPLNG